MLRPRTKPKRERNITHYEGEVKRDGDGLPVDAMDQKISID
jgi:hypothetical protein